MAEVEKQLTKILDGLDLDEGTIDIQIQSKYIFPMYITPLYNHGYLQEMCQSYRCGLVGFCLGLLTW